MALMADILIKYIYTAMRQDIIIEPLLLPSRIECGTAIAALPVIIFGFTNKANVVLFCHQKQYFYLE